MSLLPEGVCNSDTEAEREEKRQTTDKTETLGKEILTMKKISKDVPSDIGKFGVSVTDPFLAFDD